MIDLLESMLNQLSPELTIFIMVFVLIILVIIACVLVQHVQKKYIEDQIEGLAANALEMTPEEFFEMRNKSFGGRGSPLYANHFNFAGVYILYNYSKDMYYVGQAKQVLNRVNNHFTGKGNGDVYADYKYGDEFSIKMIALDESNFSTLNELERHTICQRR